MKSYTGGCMCGSVRYELTGNPIASSACHCRDCQYVSGGAPAIAMSACKEQLTILKGEPRTHWTISASGNRTGRLFCKHCGTALFGESSSDPDRIAIIVGSLDNPGSFAQQDDHWVANAQPWHPTEAPKPKFTKNHVQKVARFLTPGSAIAEPA